jgi:phosphoribosylaminoimidazole-succinocarboxamide synthase
MVDDATLAQGLKLVLAGTNFEGLGERYEGKVRDNYTRGATRFIVVTDRISAFDRVLGTIPFKGQVLNALSNFWFEATRDIAKNHSVGMPTCSSASNASRSAWSSWCART